MGVGDGAGGLAFLSSPFAENLSPTTTVPPWTEASASGSLGFLAHLAPGCLRAAVVLFGERSL